MKLLITGADGQLGKEFRKTAGQYGHEIIALNREQLDISNLDKVRETVSQHSPDIILNCAAYNFVDEAEDDFDAAYTVNTTGVRNLVFSCMKKNILLVHYSTDYVFDGSKEDFYTEEDEAFPINNYGRTKLLGEEFICEDLNDFLLFRVSWVFGEGKQNFFYKLSEWTKKNRVLKIVCDQISVPTYTEDIVSLTMFALNRRLRGIYHLTNSGYASRYEVARYFIEHLGLDNLVLPVTSDYFNLRASRPYFSAMSNLKLSKELNVEIPDWRLGVNRYIDKYIRGS